MMLRKPRKILLEYYPDTLVADLNDEQQLEIWKSGFFFLTFIAEASGLFDGTSEFNATFTAYDEANIVFQYVFLLFSNMFVMIFYDFLYGSLMWFLPIDYQLLCGGIGIRCTA